MFEIQGKFALARVFADQVDDETMGQIARMASHLAFELPPDRHIAIMPDTHAGKGSVIGFTMPLQYRVVPNVVGVDIGCGMMGVRIEHGVKVESFEEVDRRIRSRVPMGFEVHGEADRALREGDPFWAQINETARAMWKSYLKRGYHINPLGPPEYSYGWYEEMCGRVGMNFERAQASIGTLGGGNHFIEMGKVVDGDAEWLIVHTGSRQLGEKVCRYWQGVATENQKSKRGVEYERQIQKIRETARNQDIPGLIEEYRKRAGVHAGPRELDYLEGQEFFGYLWDMIFAQSYAKLNRRIILSECLDVLGLPVLLWAVEGLGLETVHNYIDFEDLVVRKGAVRAHKNDSFILPFNMRDGTIICQGVGNPEWNASAPHGAGRLFSRSHAKRALDPSQAAKEMEGIYTSVIPLDEAPGAYRPAGVIEAAIGDTARVIERVRPVLNMKAG